MAKTKYSTEENAAAQQIVDATGEDDRIGRWRAVAELGRKMNPEIMKEHRAQSKAMAEVRRHKIYRTERKKGQLMFGVSIPPMTWELLKKSDRLICGESLLDDAKKGSFESKDATNTLVQDLRTAFPEYRTTN